MSQIRVHGLAIPPEVLEFALELRGAHPAVAAKLAAMVKAVGDAATYEMLSCGPDMLQRAQGRAQGIQALASLLAEPEEVRRRHTPNR